MMNCQDLQQVVLQSMLFLKRWMIKMLGNEYLNNFSCEFTELYRYKRVSCLIYILQFKSLRQFGSIFFFLVLFPNVEQCNICYYN